MTRSKSMYTVSAFLKHSAISVSFVLQQDKTYLSLFTCFNVIETPFYTSQVKTKCGTGKQLVVNVISFIFFLLQVKWLFYIFCYFNKKFIELDSSLKKMLSAILNFNCCFNCVLCFMLPRNV